MSEAYQGHVQCYTRLKALLFIWLEFLCFFLSVWAVSTSWRYMHLEHFYLFCFFSLKGLKNKYNCQCNVGYCEKHCICMVLLDSPHFECLVRGLSSIYLWVTTVFCNQVSLFKAIQNNHAIGLMGHMANLKRQCQKKWFKMLPSCCRESTLKKGTRLWGMNVQSVRFKPIDLRNHGLLKLKGTYDLILR